MYLALMRVSARIRSIDFFASIGLSLSVVIIYLDTGASDVGLGAVLSQEVKGAEHVVAYFSFALNYCATQQELLVVSALKHFWLYLYGQTFLLWTDHHLLLCLIMRESVCVCVCVC